MLKNKIRERKTLDQNVEFWADQLTFVYSYIRQTEERGNDNPLYLSNVLPGITDNEQLVLGYEYVMQGWARIQKKVWPFDQGSQDEWIWGSLVSFAIDEDLCFYRECWGWPTTPWIWYFETTYGVPNRSDYDLRDTFDIDDGFGLSEMFYPHGWTERSKLAINRRLEEVKREADFVFEKTSEKIWQSCFDYLAERYGEGQGTWSAETKLAAAANPCETILKPAKSKSNDLKFLYLMKCESSGCYKIGVSKNPKFRESTLQHERPSVVLVGSWKNAGYLEKHWHRYFEAVRKRGEWFNLTAAQVRFFCSVMARGNEGALAALQSQKQYAYELA